MQAWSSDDVTRYSSKAVFTVFLLLYRVANQVLMRPGEYKAVFRKAVFRWYTDLGIIFQVLWTKLTN